MNIGDYVRTNYGTIVKIEAIDEEVTLSDKGYIDKENIIKSSLNILELLEPMDLLYIDIDGGFEGGIVVPRVAETQNELNGFVEFIKSGHWILKGIVTHEQLESMKYKL